MLSALPPQPLARPDQDALYPTNTNGTLHQQLSPETYREQRLAAQLMHLASQFHYSDYHQAKFGPAGSPLTYIPLSVHVPEHFRQLRDRQLIFTRDQQAWWVCERAHPLLPPSTGAPVIDAHASTDSELPTVHSDTPVTLKTASPDLSLDLSAAIDTPLTPVNVLFFGNGEPQLKTSESHPINVSMMIPSELLGTISLHLTLSKQPNPTLFDIHPAFSLDRLTAYSPSTTALPRQPPFPPPPPPPTQQNIYPNGYPTDTSIPKENGDRPAPPATSQFLWNRTSVQFALRAALASDIEKHTPSGPGIGSRPGQPQHTRSQTSAPAHSPPRPNIKPSPSPSPLKSNLKPTQNTLSSNPMPPPPLPPTKFSPAPTPHLPLIPPLSFGKMDILGEILATADHTQHYMNMYPHGGGRMPPAFLGKHDRTFSAPPVVFKAMMEGGGGLGLGGNGNGKGAKGGKEGTEGMGGQLSMFRYPYARPPSQLQRSLPPSSSDPLTDPLTEHEHEQEYETGDQPPVPQRPKLQHAATTPAAAAADGEASGGDVNVNVNGASVLPGVPTIPESPSESAVNSPSESAANSPSHSAPPPPYQLTPSNTADTKCEHELVEGATGTPLVGNLFLSSCPGKKVRLNGPVRGRGTVRRDVKQDLNRMKDMGVGCVVCCLDDDELGFLGAPWDEYSVAAAELGLDVLRIPIPEGLAPLSPSSLDGHLTRLIETYTLNGVHVLVHCRGGVGRAGLIACCWMLRLGLCGWLGAVGTNGGGGGVNGTNGKRGRGSTVAPTPALTTTPPTATTTPSQPSMDVDVPTPAPTTAETDTGENWSDKLRQQGVRKDALRLVERVISVVRRRRSLKAVETYEQVKFLVAYVEFMRECMGRERK